MGAYYGEEAGAERVGASEWEGGNAVEPALAHGEEEGALANHCLPDVGAIGGRVRAVLYGGVGEGRREIYQYTEDWVQWARLSRPPKPSIRRFRPRAWPSMAS